MVKIFNVERHKKYLPNQDLEKIFKVETQIISLSLCIWCTMSYTTDFFPPSFGIISICVCMMLLIHTQIYFHHLSELHLSARVWCYSSTHRYISTIFRNISACMLLRIHLDISITTHYIKTSSLECRSTRSLKRSKMVGREIGRTFQSRAESQ
jgi:hypothetical protein